MSFALPALRTDFHQMPTSIGKSSITLRRKCRKPDEQRHSSTAQQEWQQHYIAPQGHIGRLQSMGQECRDKAFLSTQIASKAPLQ